MSRILSDLLKLGIFNVSMISYEAFQQKEVQILQRIGQYLKGQRILLVDEIVDTGKSLVRAIEYLKHLRVKQIVTASLYVKPGTIKWPNYFQKQTNKWVIFPYEIRESVANLLPIYAQLGLNQEKLIEDLTKLGMNESRLRKVVGLEFIDSEIVGKRL